MNGNYMIAQNSWLVAMKHSLYWNGGGGGELLCDSYSMGPVIYVSKPTWVRGCSPCTWAVLGIVKSEGTEEHWWY